MKASTTTAAQTYDISDVYVQPSIHTESENIWTRRRQSLASVTKAGLVPGQRKFTVHWGRRPEPTWSASLVCVGIMSICPVLVLVTSIALKEYKGSLAETLEQLAGDGLTNFLAQRAPVPTLNFKALVAYIAWVLFQAVVYHYIPAQLSVGQRTPAGYLLLYYTNGLRAWTLTHFLFIAAIYLAFLDPAWPAKNWTHLIVIFNIYGFMLPIFAYIKAHVAPTHAEDRKFSGSMIYDFYMGIEFNPRFGEMWDFKLFHNGRPGIIAWNLINLSFAALQHEMHGFITRSMILVNILQAIYVLDFFYNEDWYLRTIDICHDHFGFYLGWGSIVWLPTMYTIQAQYLAYNPVEISTSYSIMVGLIGIMGYAIFRNANHQKDIVRRTNGKCKVWGAEAQVIECQYVTADGKEHESLLLCSGWWGVSRHANYLGDLILSYSMCAACGFNDLLPWFYAIYMTVLLLHRCKRSEERCAAKYGGTWAEYRLRVRWMLIPGIF